MMQPIVSVQNLSKTYASGLVALDGVSLDIARGEILALLGPNGAGKTTLISIICGIVTKSAGTVLVGGHDSVTDFRAARALIGLVPQELHLSIFETVWDTVSFSRQLYGRKTDAAYIETLLRMLSLWDKRNAKIMTLSGGMKRRVLIAKALSHQPQILFLDEPTAGVDVGLRKEMWSVIRSLKATGVTVILTTHYIDEAEEMADRVGVIDKGRLILVEEKATLMQKLGQKKLSLHLAHPVNDIPASLKAYRLHLSPDGSVLTYVHGSGAPRDIILRLLKDAERAKLDVHDISTEQSSLEDIFMGLVAK
jgi:ABC-2 type transport system ATP-binding protein